MDFIMVISMNRNKEYFLWFKGVINTFLKIEGVLFLLAIIISNYWHQIGASAIASYHVNFIFNGFLEMLYIVSLAAILWFGIELCRFFTNTFVDFIDKLERDD